MSYDDIRKENETRRKRKSLYFEMGKDVKLIALGDHTSGKVTDSENSGFILTQTTLLYSYKTNSYPAEKIPTLLDNYNTSLIVDGIPVDLGIWDTGMSFQ